MSLEIIQPIYKKGVLVAFWYGPDLKRGIIDSYDSVKNSYFINMIYEIEPKTVFVNDKDIWFQKHNGES